MAGKNPKDNRLWIIRLFQISPPLNLLVFNVLCDLKFENEGDDEDEDEDDFQPTMSSPGFHLTHIGIIRVVFVFVVVVDFLLVRYQIVIQTSVEDAL